MSPVRHVTARESREGKLLVRLARAMRPDRPVRLEATIRVSIANPRLAQAMTRAIADAMRAASAGPPPALRVVHARTLKAARALDAAALTGAIAIVRVTGRNARHLPEIVDAIRNALPLAVQMVWDGRQPERSNVEQWVFLVLEKARSTPKSPPVILSKSEEPAFSLRIMVASRKDECK